MTEGLVEILSNKLAEKNISVYKFSKDIGIPKERIYKWQQGKGFPKSEDVELITTWLKEQNDFNSGETSEIPLTERTGMLNETKETGPDYITKRRQIKAADAPFLVPLIPVEAQAGYSKGYNNADFINKLDYYPIVPGIDPHGAVWRYFQISGDSMLDFLNNGDYVLASQVTKEDWPDLKDALVYVIVTDELVTIKRVVKRPKKQDLVLVPDNEKYNQVAVPLESVKEIWKYRRHIGWNASTPKKIEIRI